MILPVELASWGLPILGQSCRLQLFPQLFQTSDHIVAVLGGDQPAWQGGRYAAAGHRRDALFPQFGRNVLLHEIQVLAVQNPQHVFVAGNPEPQRTFGKKMEPGRRHPLVTAMQAAAITQPPNQGLWIRWKDKTQQLGAFAAFLAFHKDRMPQWHKTIKPEVFTHLYAFFRHLDLFYKTNQFC